MEADLNLLIYDLLLLYKLGNVVFTYLILSLRILRSLNKLCSSRT